MCRLSTSKWQTAATWMRGSNRKPKAASLIEHSSQIRFSFHLQTSEKVTKMRVFCSRVLCAIFCVGRDFSYMTKNAVDTEIVDRHAPTEFCRWIVSNFTMCLLTMVSTGTSFHLAASHSLMVLTSAQVRMCEPPGTQLQPCAPRLRVPLQNKVENIMQWDRYRIFCSGPRVPGCYNGKIQSFYAESGPFPDYFWNFSGLLVVILQFIALEYKLLFLARRIFVHSIDIHHFKIIVLHNVFNSSVHWFWLFSRNRGIPNTFRTKIPNS